MNIRILYKSFLVIGLLNIAAIIQSCCDDQPVESFQLTEMNVSNFNKTTLDEIEKGSEINYSEYSIRILFDIEVLAQAAPKTGIYNSALAFDCDDDIIPQLSNRILEAEILATSNFDSTHPEGSILNDLFEYRRVIEECIENGGDFEQCGENQSEFSFNNNLVDILNNSFSSNDYYNSLDTRFTDLNLAILNAEPIISETQFILHLTFENGQVWRDTTELVVFN